MSLMKSLIIVAAIALSLAVESQAKTFAESISRLCNELGHDMYMFHDLQVDGQEAYKFARKWIVRNTSPVSNERGLVSAWKDILDDKECSAYRWKQLYMMSVCQTRLLVPTVDRMIQAFTKKCVTPEALSQKIIWAPTSQFVGTGHVDLLDAGFILKYHQDNPKDIPLHVDLRGHEPLYNSKLPQQTKEEENCCTVKKSFGALIDSIKRDLVTKSKEPKSEFKNSAAVTNYLKKNLINPCKRMSQTYGRLVDEIRVISQKYEGGQQALISSLDPEAKDILFEYMFCTSVLRQQKEISKEVASKFE